MTGRSPLLGLPGAVAGEGADAPVAAHLGSIAAEQRALVAGEGFVDLSHRDVLRLVGPERLTWLHSLTTQHFEALAPRTWTSALVLSPEGHVEHAFHAVDDAEAATLVLHTEPGAGAALAAYLERMKFWTQVEISDATAELAVTWRPRADAPRVAGGAPSVVDHFDLVPRDQLEAYAAAAGPVAGLWAYEALRIEQGVPRFGVDTDHRTIPNEVGWLESAVHLDKGCYRGQETVARVHNLGRPPRRLVRLLLDGSENRLPAPGTEVLGPGADKAVGVVGSSARHHELGPVALALVKRNVPVDAELVVAGIPAGQDVVVDPEVGLHFRRR